MSDKLQFVVMPLIKSGGKPTFPTPSSSIEFRITKLAAFQCLDQTTIREAQGWEGGLAPALFFLTEYLFHNCITCLERFAQFFGLGAPTFRHVGLAAAFAANNQRQFFNHLTGGNFFSQIS